MKKLQNNFTTPEQSKLLLELGVPANSADCYFLSTDGITTWVRGVADKHMNWFGTIDRTPIPCWSVGRLIEIYVYLTSREYVSLIFNKTFTPMGKILNKLKKDTANGMLDFSKLEE